MVSSVQYRQDILRLYRYLKPFRYQLVFLILVMILAGATTAALNALIKWLMDDLIIQGRLDLIPKFTLLVAGIYIVRAGLTYYASYGSRWIGARVVHQLRKRIFAHLVYQSMPYYQIYPPGQLGARVVHDAEVLETGMTHALTDLFLESFKALAVLIYIMMLNWRLTLVSSIMFPLMVFPVIFFGRRLRHSTDMWHQTLGQLSQYFIGVIRGIRTVQAFLGEERESKRFESFSKKTLLARRRVIHWQALHTPFVEIAIAAGLLGLILYGVTEIQANRLTPGGFTAFVSGLFLIYTPVRKLSRANALLQEMATATDRLEELIQKDERIQDVDTGVPLPLIRSGISFEHVSFAYSADQPVLHDINLTLPHRSITVLVGPSGSGKTTLAQLIPRFYDPQSGTIRIDGIDIRQIRLADLRKSIGWVPQHVFVFPGTILHNITYGKPDATMEEICQAARDARALDFIEQLPDGWQTRIGEGGQDLSGGQLQRLALARALLIKPQILILDEATSAVDSETERIIHQTLLRLKKQCTIILIAHRMTSVRIGDLIVVMDQGRIIDQGTHEDLLNRCDLYASLYHLQTASHEISPVTPVGTSHHE